MASLTLTNVCKTFPGGVKAVEDVSLDVADGELLVLVGPSGCGKTTTLRMIAGLERPSSGSVAIDGRDQAGVPPNRRDVAMVFQSRALYPNMNVRRNMAFGLALRRAPHAEINSRVQQTAEMLGISELLGRRPGELSAGQQQRVALGRAIVRRPRLFLLDEPFSNLDTNLRDRIARDIRRLHAQLGTTMICVTHDQDAAMTLGGRLAVLGDGRLRQVATPMTIYRRPASRFVAELIGRPAINFLTARIEQAGRRLICSAGCFTFFVPDAWASTLEPYVDRPITIGIRPEHLLPTADPPTGDTPHIPGSVEAVESTGPDVFLWLNAGRRTLVSRAGADCLIALGDRIELSVKLDDLLLFDPESQAALLPPR